MDNGIKKYHKLALLKTANGKVHKGHSLKLHFMHFFKYLFYLNFYSREINVVTMPEYDGNDVICRHCDNVNLSTVKVNFSSE